MRIFENILLFQSYQFRHFLYRPYIFVHGKFLMDPDRLPDDILYEPSGVHGPERILKYDLYLFSQLPQLFPADMVDVLSEHGNFSRCRLVEQHDRIDKSGFPTAGFSHDSQRLFSRNRQGNIVHRLDRKPFLTEKLVLYREIFL